MTENQKAIVIKYRKEMYRSCRAIYNNWLRHLTDEEFLEAMKKIANATDEEEIEEMLSKRTIFV